MCSSYRCVVEHSGLLGCDTVPIGVSRHFFEIGKSHPTKQHHTSKDLNLLFLCYLELNSQSDQNLFFYICVYGAHYATSWIATGLNPHGVIGNFHWHNPSSHTMALGSTQPLTEISTRHISWGVKVAGACGWQPYHLHVLSVLKSGSLNLLEPLELVQAWIALLFTCVCVCVCVWESVYMVFM